MSWAYYLHALEVLARSLQAKDDLPSSIQLHPHADLWCLTWYLSAWERIGLSNSFISNQSNPHNNPLAIRIDSSVQKIYVAKQRWDFLVGGTAPVFCLPLIKLYNPWEYFLID